MQPPTPPPLRAPTLGPGPRRVLEAPWALLREDVPVVLVLTLSTRRASALRTDACVILIVALRSRRFYAQCAEREAGAEPGCVASPPRCLQGSGRHRSCSPAAPEPRRVNCMRSSIRRRLCDLPLCPRRGFVPNAETSAPSHPTALSSFFFQGYTSLTRSCCTRWLATRRLASSSTLH